MKTCKRCGGEKPLTAFSPRKDAKDGLAYWCTSCKTAATTNGPNRKLVTQRYYARNREACVARSMECMAKKPEHYAQMARENQAKRDVEHVRALRRDWYRRNASKEIARVRARAGRLRSSLSILSLADQAEVAGLYRFCQLFRGFEVDHLIPLNGKTVSGLHVPENLQVLSVTANRSKGRRIPEHLLA
jgi:hypothetical protein